LAELGDGFAGDPDRFLCEFDEVMAADRGEVIGLQATVLLGRTMCDERSGRPTGLGLDPPVSWGVARV